MTSAQAKRVVGWATLTALVAAPLLSVLVTALMGRSPSLALPLGTLVGTVFFASTGFLAAQFQDARDLKSVLLSAYVTKITLLVTVAILLPKSLDRDGFAIAVVLSSIAYVTTSTVLFARLSRGRSSGAPC